MCGGTGRRSGSRGDGPSRRYGHSGIFDAARDRVVISHGFSDAGRFDDTWSYEFGQGRWRDISPRNSRPLRRCLHHAVYDSMRGQLLLYGGSASGFGPCPLEGWWSFDLVRGEWTEQLATPAPAPRQYCGRSYDVGRDRMILFGGSGRGTLSDTWEFNPGTRQWREAVSDGPAPSARFRQESAYGEGITYFFGGSTDQGLTNELWQLGPRQAAVVTAVVNAFDVSSGAGECGELEWVGLAHSVRLGGTDQWPSAGGAGGSGGGAVGGGRGERDGDAAGGCGAGRAVSAGLESGWGWGRECSGATGAAGDDRGAVWDGSWGGDGGGGDGGRSTG